MSDATRPHKPVPLRAGEPQAQYFICHRDNRSLKYGSNAAVAALTSDCARSDFEKSNREIPTPVNRRKFKATEPAYDPHNSVAPCHGCIAVGEKQMKQEARRQPEGYRLTGTPITLVEMNLPKVLALPALLRIDGSSELASYYASFPCEAYYAAEYVDYQSDDGHSRKLRIVLIDAVPYACHRLR